MNSKGKGATTKVDYKGTSRPRPPRDENQKPPLSDNKKKVPVGRKTAEVQSQRTPAANGPLVQQKTQAVTTTSWVKGGSSLSFADIVRKKAENVVPTPPVEHSEEPATVHVEEEVVVDVTQEVQEEEPINVQPLNGENEDDIPYDAMQQDSAIEAAIPAPQVKVLEDVPAIKYYVLEIDRIMEESVLLPSRATTIADEHSGTYIFSGQSGKPPTPPVAQVQQQFYRPETTTVRPFAGMGTISDINRGSHWNAQPGHSVDYSNVNWALQDRSQRPFHQPMQYNSYPAPVQQQTQRNFIPPPVNRTRQNEVSDASLRAFRDAGAFNRHPGNGGGVW
ncbi:TC38 protein [Trypanosoma theileri]|uniref:TC38 protein n=1 Tax=Trypanosoma theileri TaxID=67003 RepID=A0A1X0P6F6_9TRYP|nr:TC38 protein [Trypanosoma theileri]ORC92526.1 TC38 protein [Trypanosoma theileri]